jgi:hypothetical protein
LVDAVSAERLLECDHDFLVLVCTLTIGCDGLFEPDFPPFAIKAAPPPQYRVWWEVVESCSGRLAPFSAVNWYRIPVGSGLSIDGKSAAGAWFVSGNRIAIGDGWRVGITRPAR